MYIRLFVHSHHQAIQKNKKGFTVYLSWGYNRCWHTKSNIHFKNVHGKINPMSGLPDLYDFTVYKAAAKDRSNFEGIKDIKNLTIPQYNIRIGFYFNDDWHSGIELSFDHTKYIVKEYQYLHVEGIIQQTYINKDTLIDPNTFLHFEHSDGANFLMVNYLNRFKIVESKKKYFGIHAITKYGAGIVVPRTDVRMFGNRINNKFHVAGIIVGVDVGLRITLMKYAFVDFETKATYAYYINSLVQGKKNGSASHRFATLQCALTAGIQVPF